MDLPRNGRGLDDDVIIAWADASARLAAELRRAQGAQPRPELCIVRDRPPCQHAAMIGAAVAILYWPYTKLFHCACQWHLAFEVHPLFHAVHWMTATGVSILWQVYDRAGLMPQRRR